MPSRESRPRRGLLLLCLLLAFGAAACRRQRATSTVVEPVPAQVVAQRPCVPTGPEVCFNGLDDNCNGLLDEGCGVWTGMVHFMASWAEPDVDVDLHVIDPGGQVAEVGHVSESGLTKHHDCPAQQNVCSGQNYESVYLEGDEPPPGLYRVTVRLDSLGSADPPIVVRLGARIGGTAHNLLVRLMHEQDESTLSFRLGGVSEEAESGVPSEARGTGTR
jgi:hypothetical protein